MSEPTAKEVVEELDSWLQHYRCELAKQDGLRSAGLLRAWNDETATLRKKVACYAYAIRVVEGSV